MEFKVRGISVLAILYQFLDVSLILLKVVSDGSLIFLIENSLELEQNLSHRFAAAQRDGLLEAAPSFSYLGVLSLTPPRHFLDS